jgi:hypothetical protein
VVSAYVSSVSVDNPRLDPGTCTHLPAFSAVVGLASRGKLAATGHVAELA